MTMSPRTVQSDRSACRANSRQNRAVSVPPPRREYRERDFGVGYGRSSGYASDRHYATPWAGAVHFRCV